MSEPNKFHFRVVTFDWDSNFCITMMLNKQKKSKKRVTKATEMCVWTKCRGNLFNDVSGGAEVVRQLISKRSSLTVGHPFPMQTFTAL